MIRKRWNNLSHLGHGTLSLLPLLGLVLLLIGGCWIWLVMTSPNWFPFKHVRIVANYSYIPAPQLQRIVRRSIQGGFFSLNVAKLKRELLQQSWVDQVAIRRLWPSTLLVRVIEHHPVARWNEGGLLSEQGKVFYPNLAKQRLDLPHLMGTEQSAPRVLNEYRSLSTLLLPLKLKIAKLRLTARDSWEMRLANGIRVNLGRENIDMRMEKFVLAYPQLRHRQSASISQVDLRYPNGFAVAWQP